MAAYILFLLNLCFRVVNGFILDTQNSPKAQLITVNTSVGTIIGKSEPVTFANISGNVHKFLGIPYSESTGGVNRFKQATLKSRFTKPFNATVYGPTCEASEDCLYLNIFVPDRGNSSSNWISRNLSVMVFIHGGGFIHGSGNSYLGDHLTLVGDVILVTLNYRLGVFGFLSTNDSNAPGNIGLWDQRLAQTWINKNIQSFGGNPQQVTVFGEYAGAVSTLHHALYPGNAGLFQRIITESVPTDTMDNPKQKAMKLAELVSCNNTDTAKMIDCLRKVPASAIYSAMRNPELSLPHRPFVPIVDGIFIKHTENHVNFASLRDENSKQFFSSLDYLGGINSYEGLLEIPMFMNELGLKDFNNFAINQTTFENDWIPMNLQSLYGFDRYFPDKVKMMVAFAYTDWPDVNNDAKRRLNLVQLSSDYKFFLPTIEPIKTHSALANTSRSYLYQFAARTPLRSSFQPPPPTWLNGPEVANHGNELGFVFGFTAMPSIGSQDLKLSLAIMTMWTNFAKTG